MGNCSTNSCFTKHAAYGRGIYLRFNGKDGERKCCSRAWIGNGPRTFKIECRCEIVFVLLTTTKCSLTSHSRDTDTFQPPWALSDIAVKTVCASPYKLDVEAKTTCAVERRRTKCRIR